MDGHEIQQVPFIREREISQPKEEVAVMGKGVSGEAEIKGMRLQGQEMPAAGNSLPDGPQGYGPGRLCLGFRVLASRAARE